MDESFRTSGAEIGITLQSSTGEQVEQVVRLNFLTSNNEAEYEAILVGLDLALTLTAIKVEVEVIRSLWSDRSNESMK